MDIQQPQPTTGPSRDIVTIIQHVRGEVNGETVIFTSSNRNKIQTQGCGMCGGTGCGSRDMNDVAATVPGGVPLGAKSDDYCCVSGVDARGVTCGTGEDQGYPPCFINPGERICGFVFRWEGGRPPRKYFVVLEKKKGKTSIPFGAEESEDERDTELL